MEKYLYYIKDKYNSSLRSYKENNTKKEIKESFLGRINFSPYSNILNFERNIYFDKIFPYSNVSKFNKKIIPELCAAAFTELFYANNIDIEIRRNLEQYFLALMSNMDYYCSVDISQIKIHLGNQDLFNNNSKNFIFTLGVTSELFETSEKRDIIINRLKIAKEFKDCLTKERFANIIGKKFNFYNNHFTLNNKIKQCFWLDNEFLELDENYINEIQNLVKSSMSCKTAYNDVCEIKPKSGNITKTNFTIIAKYISDFKKNNAQNPVNIFIITSTFQLYKLALEIEKHYFNKEEDRPDSIVLIGDQSFYSLMHNELNIPKEDDKIIGPEKHTLHKKRIRTFMYEIFMHILDNNTFKLTNPS